MRRLCLEALEGVYGQLDEDIEEGVSKFAAAGYIELARDWLKRGCKEDPEELSAFAGQLITHGVAGVGRNGGARRAVRR